MIGKRKRRVHVFRGKDNDWRWQLKAGNGEIISTSGEGYRDLDDCLVIASETFPGVRIDIDVEGERTTLVEGEQ